MSLKIVTLRLLSLKPRILRDDQRLIIRSSWVYHVCYLFACSQRVVFERTQKLVKVNRRKWWFIRESDTTPYASIDEVGFWCKDYPEYCGDAPYWGDKYEIVWLVIRIKGTGEVIKLIPFEGEGSVETGFLGVLLGDSIFDLRGDHAESATSARLMMKKELAG